VKVSNVKILFLIVCLPSISLAAFEPIDCGEEFFCDASTVYLNPASLPAFSSATFAYARPFGMTELQYSRVSLNLRNFGAGFSLFGNTIYNECEVLLGYKLPMGKTHLGGDIRARSVSVRDYGSKFSLALDIGIRTHLRKNIMFDGVLQSSSRRVIVGFHIHPVTSTHLMVYLYKELGYCAASHTSRRACGPVGLKIGELLQVSPTLSLTFGLDTIHSSFTLGTIFTLKELKFGYLIRTHPNLGASHIVSLGYGF
jgi:hypothetical protein